MASSSPATAPVSPTPASTNAVMAIVGRMKDIGGTIFKQSKPWNEVVDRSALSKPSTLAEAAGRIRKNAAYFKVNYLIVMLTTCAVTFLMHPSSLFVLGILLGAWIYVLFVRTSPLVISGRTLSEREKVMGMAAISFITIFFLTSVGTVFFSALSISLAVICLHGAMREPDNLFLDEAESQQSFLGILTGPTSAPVTGV